MTSEILYVSHLFVYRIQLVLFFWDLLLSCCFKTLCLQKKGAFLQKMYITVCIYRHSPEGSGSIHRAESKAACIARRKAPHR